MEDNIREEEAHVEAEVNPPKEVQAKAQGAPSDGASVTPLHTTQTVPSLAQDAS